MFTIQNSWCNGVVALKWCKDALQIAFMDPSLQCLCFTWGVERGFDSFFSVYMGFPGGSAGKESACNVGDLGSIPGLGRYPGEGKAYPLQYSGLENSMDCIVHGVRKDWKWLSDFHFHTFCVYILHNLTDLSIFL